MIKEASQKKGHVEAQTIEKKYEELSRKPVETVETKK